MNLYARFILAALILEYALNLLADLLNLKSLKGDPPKEFQRVYDPASYRKSQEYTRVQTRFGILTATLGLIVLLFFWFSGGFNRFDRIVRGLGRGPIVTGLIYIGLLLLLKTLISLPFRIYSTFVVEARFGFNKTTPGIFILDSIKGLALGVVFGGPLLAVILAFYEYAGPSAWWYGWIAAALFILFIQLIAPTWLMPLFNRFEPLPSGELKERIFSYARAVHFPIDNVFVIDGSRRSTKSNAFFTGFGKRKRIALFDTLIAKHTVPELVAVLAHEIGHYKKKHILLGMVLSILHMGLMFFLLSLFISRKGLHDAFYMEAPSVYAGLLFFGLLYTPIEFFLSLFFQALSRKNEYEADRFAVETVDDPQAMAEALKKLSAHNLANLTPHPFYVFLNDSHPPLIDRVRAIREKGATSGERDKGA